jgi:hypothetical protein
MYSLKCDYYQKEFNYLHELVDDVLMSGMDPDYEITKNGVGINEKVIDLIKVLVMMFIVTLGIVWLLINGDQR